MKVNLLHSVTAALTLATVSRGDLLDTILEALENAVDCASCQALLVPVQLLAHLGDSAFGTTFTEVCKALHVGNFRETFFTVLTL